MREIIARNSKQLDTCLKMLYYENVEFHVRVFENTRGRIMFSVELKGISNQKADELKEKFNALIG